MNKFPLILADKNPCPCAMYGTAQQYEAAAIEFAMKAQECIGQEKGRPHVSDQTCVQAWKWPAIDVCFQFGRDGWQHAKMVHYSHSACAGRPREQVITEAERIRKERAEDPELAAAVDRIVAHGEKVKEELKATWIDRIRASVDFMLTESKASDNNRTRIMQELRKAGLTPGGIKYAPEKVKRGKKRRKLAKA